MKKVEIKEQEYLLQVYRGKKGWRWRFFVGDDLRCIGTNWCDDYDEAFDDAAEILEGVWTLEKPG